MVKTRIFQKSKKQKPEEIPTISIKERLAQKRKITKSRKEFTGLLTTSLVSGLFIGLLVFLVIGIKAAIPAVLGIVIISLSYKYPRQAMLAFIIYLPFGGTVIYYLGNSPVLQLAKDAFYIPALIGIWQSCRKLKQPFIIPRSIQISLIFLLICSLLTLIFINGGQQFNPPSVGLGQKVPKEIPIGLGILGFKVFLGYIPLITCTYYLIRNKRDFLFMSRLQVILILICCGLGFIQYLLLLTGVCQGTRNLTGDALFRATLEARCYFGGSLVYSPQENTIRLPGTFVAPWQWAWFLVSGTFFSFATGFSDPSIIWRIISLGSLSAIFINAVICGQRIALILVPICFLVLLIFTGQIANFKKFIPVGVGLSLILGFAIVANPVLVEERINSLFGRLDASPPQEFIMQQFEENWKSVDTIIGSGLGRATNSARSMGPTKLVETYYPKVLYEVGIVGVLAFLAFVTSLTIAAYKTYRSIKDPNLRIYAGSLFIFILFISYNTFYYPLDVDPVAVYYWVCAGLLFKLPVIDKQEKEEVQKKLPETIEAV
ncbi:hormogonium polysaccharide biosynthesis protein HpsL [Cronbergia sp. UHCC 0137]|uniref:hormogonium polysaccharide biosynthesis protein HpsL n=1 Tax=Cronbergia sp. UHCC 0137 TaxID=3110239 RepID=UPI002B211ECC|nr:hormogonium polysaccharide biosynthesis protein HpsL [Cronbergia sp. UHCC 0137]MEA5618013.1 hormogonium polysaccharide biosynthesis protein HpsL [Cronbergia sp. UHCC 0137]